ncbi:hypothetical protein F1188_03310 [Roseospira marina]|uniref:Uncharacterized protein n=1 Tax=Roseospira marina TaxID=140057 RepID=A0A5M6IF93_9PROT|nr:hypothetical protein [Roseospira marina]KAA5606954.1 hypothetical protein F1188_03310 [Roseospira marina]MBB4312870.1 hypothetical protein [Roseospira marina]MBB5086357.1 hypothetical protein [Roseospira marina]
MSITELRHKRGTNDFVVPARPPFRKPLLHCNTKQIETGMISAPAMLRPEKGFYENMFRDPAASESNAFFAHIGEKHAHRVYPLRPTRCRSTTHLCAISCHKTSIMNHGAESEPSQTPIDRFESSAGDPFRPPPQANDDSHWL